MVGTQLLFLHDLATDAIIATVFVNVFQATQKRAFFRLLFVFIGPVNLTICPIGKCQFAVLANEDVGRLWCEMTQSGGKNDLHLSTQ